MTDFEKIEYYDIRLEAKQGRLPATHGRDEEVSELLRKLSRALHRHVILVSPSGVGKTATMYKLGSELMQGALPGTPCILFNASSLARISATNASVYTDAFMSIERAILIFDGFGELVTKQPQIANTWTTLLKGLVEKKGISILLTMQPQELVWLEEYKSHFVANFEVMHLDPLRQETVREILTRQMQALMPPYIQLDASAVDAAIELCERFPALGEQPRSGLMLLDEALAHIKLSDTPKSLDRTLVTQIVASKVRVPFEQLHVSEVDTVTKLPGELKRSVLGQDIALETIISVVKRAKLGLRDTSKPLGSFLLLGPSGVGKTETAKSLAKLLYGEAGSFLRIDMSEFAQEHTVARLLGSPSGYVGHEQGGQLTNHLLRHPYTLILLDEVEKAHPKVFDIFLQLLDDGRLTSAKSEVVDATQVILFATSNLGVQVINESFSEGTDVHSEVFVRQNLMPELLKFLRAEFVNRFDSLVVFEPLSKDALLHIALKEIKAIEDRLKDRGVRFEIQKSQLEPHIERLYDPRFGARPIKRFVEELCETAVTEAMISIVPE